MLFFAIKLTHVNEWTAKEIYALQKIIYLIFIPNRVSFQILPSRNQHSTDEIWWKTLVELKISNGSLVCNIKVTAVSSLFSHNSMATNPGKFPIGPVQVWGRRSDVWLQPSDMWFQPSHPVVHLPSPQLDRKESWTVGTSCTHTSTAYVTHASLIDIPRQGVCPFKHKSHPRVADICSCRARGSELPSEEVPGPSIEVQANPSWRLS